MSKTCRHCGIYKPDESFYGKTTICKVCLVHINSINTKKRSKLYTGFCLECGKELNKSQKRNLGLFCSRTCKAVHQHNSPKVEVDCLYCRKKFYKKKSWAERSNKDFCSVECYRSYSEEFCRTTVVCETCGINYSVPTHRINSRFVLL